MRRLFAWCAPALLLGMASVSSATAEEDRQLTSLRAFFGGRPFHEAEVPPTSYPFSWDDLRGRFPSTSLAPPEGDARREEVLAGLKVVFDDAAVEGIVQFQLHWGYWWGTLQG